MQSFIELLRTRRSIRQFKDETIDEGVVKVLIETALRSPSSRSLNPWEFVVVDDKEKIAALSKAKPHGAAFMKNAPLVIVVCADPEKCDVWVEDASIASILLHLAATDLGLGSCWVQIRLRDHDDTTTAEQYVRDQISLPDNLVVEAIIAIGYPKEEKGGHPDSSLLQERVSFNTYGNR